MKLTFCRPRYFPGFLTKTQMVMKLTIALLLATCLQVYAKEGYTQRVTLNEKDVALEKVFKQIRKHSHYLYLYKREVLQDAQKVDVNVKDASIEEIMSLCMKGQSLTYTILENTVIIKRAEAEVHKEAAENKPIAIVIQGTITDSTGKPVPGVTVLVKGTKTQTMSDGNGSFKISVPSGNAILVFTSVGFKKKEIAVGAQTFMNVSLEGNPRELSEIVVTGFGESRAKRNLGYSVAQVSGDEIRQTTALNPITALQGLVTGLQVTPGVSGPSATPKFLIRGSSSLNPYGNTPLIVVDGVILDQQSVTPNVGVGPDFGNILKDLNPDDIESMSVLKGGAVTALYGSRAANGVILVKTKKGFHQKGLGVSVSQTVMLEKAYKQVDFQNQFGAGLYQTDFITSPTGQLQVNPNDYGISFGPPMTGQTVLDVTGQVRKNLPNSHDLLDLYRTGISSNTNVAISGGNETSTFRFSYSRLSEKAATPNNNFDRNSFMLRATHRIANKVLLDGNISYTRSGTLNPALQGGSSPLYQFAYDGARNYDAKYWSTHYIDSANGGVNNNDPAGLTSLIFYPLYQNHDLQNENNFRGGLDMTAYIRPWLTFQGNTSVNYYSKEYEAHHRGANPGFAGPGYYNNINDLLSLRYRGDLEAHKQFGEFATDLHVGGEVTTSETKGASYSTNGAILPDVYRLSNSKNPANVSEVKPSEQQISSAYFQGSVYWRDFSFNVYGRNDWNSTLVYNDGHGTYSYFYGGADMAWIFTDRFKNLPSFIDFGKVRLSYASAGNGTGSYTANTGNYSAGNYQTLNNGTVTTYSYASGSLPNQHLVPERTNKVETGLEFRMFQKRLGGEITYYTQQTSKQIIGFSVPSASGVGSALLNGGIVRNRGLEVTLYGTPIQTKQFTWNTRLLYTRNTNTVVTLPFGVDYLGLGGEDGIRTIAVKGGDYALMVAGYGYARYQATDANGKPVASPLNGQHVLGMFANNTQAYYVRASNYGTDPHSREPVIGSTLPKFLGSWNNTFSYKGFYLNIFLDAKIGGLEYSTTYFYGSQDGNIRSTLFGRNKALGGLSYVPVTANSQYLGFPLGSSRDDGIALSGVFRDGSKSVGSDGNTHDVSGMTFDQAYKQGFVTPVNAADYYVRTYSWSKGIREAGTFTNSWVSLREVSLGYELPSSIATKVKMNNLRLTLIARNPMYLYNSAPNHINPDNLTDTGSGSAFEEGGIPYMRRYGFMLNASF